MKNNNLKKEIEDLVENSIRPMIQLDGGDIELVEVGEKEGVVKVRLSGACTHCVLAPITLHLGVEKEIKSKFPQIKKVEMVDEKL